ncbi:hypothetical protein V7103_23225 [Neobacillus drentensis]|uniref:hypothetical protein n=1 Tax=Neobacillus drentensis TaxID=220684 RepID=UPI002FFF1959
MECFGNYYGFEEDYEDKKVLNNSGIEVGEKCIINVFPNSFHFYKISTSEYSPDGKGNGIGNEFLPSQLEVSKREIQEGSFLFKTKYYILDLSVTYDFPGRFRKCKHTIKVKERDGKNILAILNK